MLIAEICMYKDKKYKVVCFHKDEDIYTLGINEYIDMPSSVSTILKEELNKGNKIICEESIIKKSPTNISVNDFEIIKAGDLEKSKNKLLSELSNNFSHYLASISGITYFSFIISSFKLASAGYFITNENREEKYVEIMNTGDNMLIEALNDFLDSLDKISPMSGLYDHFKLAQKTVEQSKSFEDLEKAQVMFSDFFKWSI